VLDMAKALLTKHQLNRKFMYVFLIDGFRFQFFKVLRDQSSDMIFEYSAVYNGDEGWAIFSRLFTQSPANLGHIEITIDGFEPQYVLGRGGFSTVYSAIDNADNQVVVLKVFEKKYKKLLQIEVDVLSNLHANCDKYLGQTFPEVKCQVAVTSAGVKEIGLVLTPQALPILPLTGGHRLDPSMFVRLLRALEHAHRLGIAHRDVKPDNIFWDNLSNRVVLNDWSSSAKIGVPILYVGSLGFSVPDFEGSFHEPSAEADLVSLVRCVWSIYRNHYPIFPKYAWEEAEEFWARVFNKNSLWRKVFRFAVKLQYEKLAHFFGTLA